MPDPIVSTPAAPVTPPAAVAAPVTPPAGTPPSPPAAAAPAKAPEAPKPPTAAEIRKIKIILEGKEEELTEDEAKVWAQKGKGADKRFAEAAALKKQVEEVLHLMKNNTPEAMKRLGLDPRKFSEEFLVEALKREAESPEQKKIRETEEKLKAYEKAEKDREAAAAAQKAEEEKQSKVRENQRKEAEIIAKYDALFVAALEKSGLPKTAQTVHRMATLQRINIRQGRPYTADQLAEVVRNEYDAEFKTRTASLDGEKLLELIEKIDPEIMKKITRGMRARIKGKPQQFTPAAPQGQTPPVEAPGEHTSWRSLQKKRRQFQA